MTSSDDDIPSVVHDSVSAPVLSPRIVELAESEGGTARSRQPIGRSASARYGKNGALPTLSAKELHGFDAELAQREALKWDTELEDEVVGWVRKMVGAEHINGTTFHEIFKSGVVLCCLINRITPGKIPKIDTKPIPMVERSNIQLYLTACSSLGMQNTDMFLPPDLQEGKWLSGVLGNIARLGELSDKLVQYRGLDIPRFRAPASSNNLLSSSSGSRGGHRRNASVGAQLGLKPWEVEQMQKEQAHASAAQAAADMQAAVETQQRATGEVVIENVVKVGSMNSQYKTIVSEAPAPASGTIESLLRLLAPLCELDRYDIDADMRVLRQQHIRTIEHLRIAIAVPELFAQVPVSVLLKLVLKRVFTHAAVINAADSDLSTVLAKLIEADEIPKATWTTLATSPYLTTSSRAAALAASPVRPVAAAAASASSSASSSSSVVPAKGVRATRRSFFSKFLMFFTTISVLALVGSFAYGALHKDYQFVPRHSMHLFGVAREHAMHAVSAVQRALNKTK